MDKEMKERIRQNLSLKVPKERTGDWSNLTNIHEGIWGHAEDVSGDASSTMGDISNIKGDISNIRDYVSDLRGYVTNIRGSTKDIINILKEDNQ